MDEELALVRVWIENPVAVRWNLMLSRLEYGVIWRYVRELLSGLNVAFQREPLAP